MKTVQFAPVIFGGLAALIVGCSGKRCPGSNEPIVEVSIKGQVWTAKEVKMVEEMLRTSPLWDHATSIKINYLTWQGESRGIKQYDSLFMVVTTKEGASYRWRTGTAEYDDFYQVVEKGLREIEQQIQQPTSLNRDKYFPPPSTTS